MKRPGRTVRSNEGATCLDAKCGWHTEGGGSVGRAAQHYDATGHTVSFGYELSGEYGGGYRETHDAQEALL